MRKLILFLPLFFSLNCWAPHYTDWTGIRYEDWKIAPELSSGGNFAESYDIHSDKIAVLENYRYDRNDLIASAIAAGGVARKEPSKVNIYRFNGVDWVKTVSILEPDFIEATPYVSPEEPSVLISSKTGFGRDIIIRDDFLFISLPELGIIKLYTRELHPTIPNTYTWIFKNDIFPNDLTLSDVGFGKKLAFSNNILVVQNYSGDLFIYKKVESELKWSLAQEISIDDICFSKDFDLSGNILIVGSGDGCVGKVWIFENNGSKFNLTETHFSPDPSPHPADTEFGHSVSIDDLNILITHSRYLLALHDYAGAAGVAYVGRKEVGHPLSMTSTLNPNVIGTGEFGWDGAMTDNKVIINDPYFSSFNGELLTEPGIGMNYLFFRTAYDNWEYYVRLSRSDSTSSSWFGRGGVEITDDFALVADPYSEYDTRPTTIEDGADSYIDGDSHPSSAFGGIYIYDLRSIEGLYSESLEAELPMTGLGGLFILGLSLLSFRTMSLRKNV